MRVETLAKLAGAVAFLSVAAGAEQPSSPGAGQKQVGPEESLSADIQRQIDKSVTEILKTTGAPSASIAVVKDGKVVYVRAYGMADIEHHIAATTAMPYSIGSISKQFTAAAVLLLAEEGKLSLDDK